MFTEGYRHYQCLLLIRERYVSPEKNKRDKQQRRVFHVHICKIKITMDAILDMRKMLQFNRALSCPRDETNSR